MIVRVLINSLFLVIFALLGLSYQAVVNVDQSTNHPKGIIVVPENQRTSSLKVSFNETVTVNNVLVVCEIINPLGGDTKVLFTNTKALVGENNTTVNYRIISSGQPATVQCSAQSENNHTQFRFSSSKGTTGRLQATSAPIVTICDNPVFVTTETGCLTVQVQLSEAVSGVFPAVVNCSTVNDNDGPRFQFEATIVKSGQNTAKVPFTVLSKGTKTQSVQVVCKAQTYNVTLLSSWFICGGTATPTTTPVTTPPPTNTTSNITTQRPITVPTPSPPSVLNITRFQTSTNGVQYFQYLLETSEGRPVNFILNTLALQFHPSSVSIHGGYSVILSLNTPLTVPLDIECSLILLAAGQVNTSAIGCPDEPIGKITLTSVQLQLAQTEIQFKKSEVSKTLVISIDGTPSTRLSDLVQLSCCPKATAVYKPPSVAMYIFVDLHRYLPVSVLGTTTSTSPLDIDLTCPCNLKEGQCDTTCCCDKDCTTSESSAFTCMRGFFGGDSVERPFEFSCQATWPDATDLHPILCVTSSSSPFTGYWYNYTSPQSAKDIPEYKALLQSASQQNRFSYQSVTQSQSSTDGVYKLGTSVKTAANSNDNKYLSATLGTLILPSQVFSGLCAQTVSVRFLENSVSTCVSEVVESLCTETSILSASSYIMPRDLANPPCPVPAAVLRGGTLSQNQNEQPDLADVEVQYFCTADNLGKSSPWRCAFDDGKTAPPLPVLNQTSQTCTNVVLNVTYQFETSGQKVNKVKAVVILGNVKLQVQSYSSLATSESPVNTVTQYFQTKFVGASNSSNSTIVSRSGNPGYIRGLPVLALTRSSNNSILTSLPIMSLSDNSLCTSSSLTPISFGETSSSGCAIKLGIDDMRNCSRVRELVQANQKEMLKFTHVGRTGNARATIDDDWVPVIRENVKEPSSESFRVGTCLEIPYGLVYEVLVSEAGRYKGVPQMEIVGLKMSYKYTTWQYHCVSGYGLGCLTTSTSNIAPSATVSATVTPTVSVTVNASINGSSVVNNNTTTNKSEQTSSYNPRQMYFSLETEVIFIDVPSTPQVKVKRSQDQSGICYQDVCKEELFYPLSSQYQGEPKDKVMAYFLLLLFMVLVTFYFTRPWG